MLRARSAPLPPGFRLDHLAAGARLERQELAWLGARVGGHAFGELVAFGEPRAVIEADGRADPLEALQRALDEPFDRGDVRLPFAGGAIGFVGFECARWIERVSTATDGPLGFPELRVAFPARFVARDPERGDPVVVAVGDGLGGDLGRAKDEALRLEAVGRARAAAPAPALELRAAWPRADHVSRVERIRGHIAAGDVYQANLTQRFDAAAIGDPFDVHLRLLADNPSPYAAFLGFDERAIVSASPELFLKRRGAALETRPIKGTRARTGDAGADAAARAELLASEKDGAELAMIVDLERNDLSRVCRPGTVRVERARDLETFATVFHLVATVTGELRAGARVLDVLRATFPGGSITGCPKIRAIEILSDLEREPRGPCFGAIGWIGHDGDLDLNVAIRTIVCRGDRATFRVGGGIVADSEPAAEYVETLAKARALARALGDRGFPDSLQWRKQN